jgi:protein gp138/GpV-like protein with Apex motif
MIDRREELDDAEEAQRLAMEGFQAGLWTALPGIVTKVDLDAQTVEVQPAIKGEVLDENGQTTLVNLPILADVPICWPRGGGFALTFPIVAGDEVLVVFSSRCIDSWWQSSGVQKAAEFRMHDLSDGFAILAPTSQPKKLANVNANSVELRNEAGTNYVRLSNGTISLKATEAINIDAPIVNITGVVNQTGNYNQVSGVQTFNGINFATHKHTGVQTGGGTSGGPIP